MNKFKLSFPSSINLEGDIIVADPCDFIQSDTWDELMDMWFDENYKETKYANQGIIDFDNGVKVIYAATAHPSGKFPIYLQRGNGESIHNDNVNIESGMISVISVDDVRKLNPKFNINDDQYPRINDFEGIIKADGKGNFIGDLSVDTQDDFEEDEDDFYEEDDFYDDYNDSDDM